jgi:hypothetical protein
MSSPELNRFGHSVVAWQRAPQFLLEQAVANATQHDAELIVLVPGIDDKAPGFRVLRILSVSFEAIPFYSAVGIANCGDHWLFSSGRMIKIKTEKARTHCCVKATGVTRDRCPVIFRSRLAAMFRDGDQSIACKAGCKTPKNFLSFVGREPAPRLV